MTGLEPVGRALLVIGVVLVGVGLLLVLAPKIPFIGRLPGDIRIENESTRIFIPIGTMILVSIILTIVLNLIGRR